MSAAQAHSPAQLLVVDDDEAFRKSLSIELQASGHRVAEASDGAGVHAALSAGEIDVVLLDLRLAAEDGMSLLEQIRARSSSEVIMLTGHGTVPSAMRAMRLGAADYLLKPCDLDELELAVARAVETRRLKERNVVLERGLQQRRVELIGRSPAFLKLMGDIDRAASSASNALIVGESGTGKELIARALHQASRAHDKPFVVVDCTSLSDELMHSELFGHEPGAFTGAVGRKHGLFEVADGGTLCLDEIGEITPRVQAKLLRVLETSTFRRMGGTREISVRVRVLSSTNRRLESAVRAGTFREDLYYRLSTLRIDVPPLRERREDVAVLGDHFLRRGSRGAPRHFSPDAIEALSCYTWPGNVRELAAIVERLILLRPFGEIVKADVECMLKTNAAAPIASPIADLTLAEIERAHIDAVIRKCGGHRAEAARILGLSERTLYRKLQGGAFEP